MEHGSKEYYEKQSEYWFDEASKFLKQRDELIGDIAKLRERNKELENMWRTVKNELLGRYEHYCFKIRELHPESKANRIGALYIGGKSTADIILSRMEELDGTNEFYEFLGQMEDDTNE
ncbi:TPA: acetyltransferase [Staphylococcus aureus]|uniref:acetyltransferase n=1 Tax=Staphylococcus aureus TaxID=1280 RepID=UPI000E3E9FDF|nr:acetyltransferase [Staphylococcus aureus]QPN96409.1 acetyltransferase [Staphylococcus phage IME1364_02]MCR0673127.1 acetyltransferase [Staphylococcus aureus]MDD9399143.1 acetyltransferase [Staphylococcus aureus]MDD9450087.1 acetyltransferase [Staphylococcus aureus]MDD9552344.1 acetyltransferase [Staphylococcus aureus]